jgi:hypothetical protein
MLPQTWLENAYPDPAARLHYQSLHALEDLPSSLVDFPDFYSARKRRLTERLVKLLGV